MELGLSLGDTPKPFGFMEKTHEVSRNKGLGFCMGLSIGPSVPEEVVDVHERREEEDEEEDDHDEEKQTSAANTDEAKKTSVVDCGKRSSSADPPIQLDLLPNTPVSRNQLPSFLPFPWTSDNGKHS